MPDSSFSPLLLLLPKAVAESVCVSGIVRDIDLIVFELSCWCLPLNHSSSRLCPGIGTFCLQVLRMSCTHSFWGEPQLISNARFLISRSSCIISSDFVAFPSTHCNYAQSSAVFWKCINCLPVRLGTVARNPLQVVDLCWAQAEGICIKKHGKPIAALHVY